jgi:hypothetical protein
LPVVACAAERQVGQLPAEGNCIDAIGGGVEEGDGFAVVIEGEAGVQAREVGKNVAPEDQVISRAYDSAGGENESAWITVVGHAPTREVYAGRAGVSKFEPVGEHAAVGDGTGVFGHQFIDANGGNGWQDGDDPRRAVLKGAGAPVGWSIGIGGRVDRFERVAATIGPDRPWAAIGVIDGYDGFTRAAFDGDAFTAVG